MYYQIKPYLRSLSSMTNAERDRMRKDINKTHEDITDWLDKYHFDYRGLIKKGLALEAPENMYKHFGDMDLVVASVEHKDKL